MMELRHLRYFVVLADELHFGRAAQRLSMTQPPLSFNIKQLEASLGVTLFERSSKGVKLTPAGDSFRESALRLLAEAEQAQTLARQVAAGTTSKLRVGFVGSMIFRGLPERLRSFQEAHPLVQVQLTELNSAEQVEAIGRGQLDVGFVHTSRIPADMKRFMYMSEPFVCCLPQAHPAAGQASVELRALSSDAFVLFSRGASPDYFERILALCAEQGLQPLVKHEVRHWLSVVSLVAKGVGVAVVPNALREAGIAGVRFVPLAASKYRSEVYCVWQERRLPTALPALLDVFRATPAQSDPSPPHPRRPA